MLVFAAAMLLAMPMADPGNPPTCLEDFTPGGNPEETGLPMCSEVGNPPPPPPPPGSSTDTHSLATQPSPSKTDPDAKSF